VLRKLIFIGFLLFLSNLKINAQIKVKAYESIDAYISNKPIELNDIYLYAADKHDTGVLSIQEYFITSNDKKIKNKILNSYWIIETDSFKYLNCWLTLKNKQFYARILYSTSDFLYFKGIYGQAMGLRKEIK
jgi:hypothetical protein